VAGSAGDTVRAGLELDPAERAALWAAASQAIGRAEEQLRAAAASGDPAARAVAEAAAVATSEVLAAVGRLTERSGAGPLHRAAARTTGPPAGCAAACRSRPARPAGPAGRPAACAAWSSSASGHPPVLQLVEQLSRLA
jgi:hypothetical protein